MGREARVNGKCWTVCMDFDDLADGNDRLDVLMRLKERDPGFKVTLFAIPTRCSDDLLHKYAALKDWIQLGIHGWRHARHECLSWTSEETKEKLEMARGIYPGFASIFKAPQWETCDELYAGLKECGFAIADHIRNIPIIPEDMPNYIYNIRLREDRLRRMHGHIQPPIWDKGLEGDYELWSSPPIGSTYVWATEATMVGIPVDWRQVTLTTRTTRETKEFAFPIGYPVAASASSKKPTLDDYDDTDTE